MDNSHRIINSFRVPKIKSKEPLEKILLKNSEFQTDIYPKLVDSYIKPRQSEKLLSFVNAWLINNPKSENTFMRRRMLMRKENPNLTESIGFVYMNSKENLSALAKSGYLNIGNVKDSCLGTGTMGISICQHADIFHPGDLIYGIPRTGYLVIVKYLKGKINFVQYDKNPMEPQPQYDCHMLRNQIIEKNSVSFKAFHMSQVFIYEYTEDGEIVNHPTQILPFAAVEFQWYGSYIFRISHPVSTKPKPLEHYNDRVFSNDTDIILAKSLEEKRLSRFQMVESSVHRKDSTFSLPCQLVFINSKDKSFNEIKITSTVYMYMSNPVVFPHLYTSQWKISDVIETTEFEKQLKLFQFYLQDKITKSNTDLLDPLSHDIIISTNSPTLLTISENKINEPFLLSNDTTIPKYTTYLRIVPDSSKQSKHRAFRLIQHFNNSKTIARISLGLINDQYKSTLFIFPDGKLSQKLGLPSIESKEYYFHGLLLHFQHPEFSLCCLSQESSKEKAIYFTGLSDYRRQTVMAKFNSKSIIDLDILKQTSIDQATVQKELFAYLLKPNNNNNIQNITYPQILAENEVVELCDKMINLENPIDNILPVNEIVIEEPEFPDLIQDQTDLLEISLPNSVSNEKNHTATSIPNAIQTKHAKYLNGRSSSMSHKKLTSISPKKHKLDKSYVSESETLNLKSTLYNILKNPHKETENFDIDDLTSEKPLVESNSIIKDASIPNNVDSNCENMPPVSNYTVVEYNDLVPVRQKITYDNSNGGSFNELIFINEYHANISNSNQALFLKNFHFNYSNRNYRYEKMWTFNRFIFRKVKHLAGISVYQGSL